MSGNMPQVTAIESIFLLNAYHMKNLEIHDTSPPTYAFQNTEEHTPQPTTYPPRQSTATAIAT
jgi:hypothetical protein